MMTKLRLKEEKDPNGRNKIASGDLADIVSNCY